MNAVELLLVAIGLSMDAFAVAVCKGLGMKKFKLTYTLVAASFFGGFQALMPCLGWLLGTQFQRYIVSIDHWVAFGMLLYIGIKMIRESIGDSGREVVIADVGIDYRELLVLAVATSIDALAVGLTIAFLNCSVILSSAIIGAVTFGLTIVGVVIGVRFGGKMERKAGIAGGVILITIGTKILLEHLGVITILS